MKNAKYKGVLKYKTKASLKKKNYIFTNYKIIVIN